MVGKRLLSAVIAFVCVGLAIPLFGVSPALAVAETCNTSSLKLGTCHISAYNDGHEVTVDGRAHTPGSEVDAPVGGGHPGSHAPGSVPKPAPWAVDHPGRKVDRPGYTVTMPVTLADLAKFRPNPGTDHMQPDGWMIVGLPTNFYARATQHVKSGPLLGESAYVRFTPARYAWTYGDGTSRNTSAHGATWEALGLHEFDATATSHIYRHPGRYVIDLTIGYSPEYRYATSTEWIPLAGYVWVPANRLVATAAAGAKTVLVEDECTVNPNGPGC